MSMINVLDHPDVDGDGVNDDTEGLQELINDASGALYFPPGRYKITSTLNFPNKTGYHVLGCGMAQRVPFSSAAKGCESVIVWGGETSGTMIEYQGQGLVWNGLSLWGCNWPGSSSSCPGPRAGTGILIRRDSAGDPLEPGRIWFGSLMVEDCDNAVGIPASAANEVSEIAFGYFWAKGCNIAFRVQTGDAMNFSFQYVHAEDCGIVFGMFGGGRLFTQAVRVLSDNTTVLVVFESDETNGFYHINGLAVDDGVDNTRLLNNPDNRSGTQHVRFTNAQLICSDTSACPPNTPGTSANCRTADVMIDRRNSADGKTMLEFVGCRGLSALNGKVRIQGSSPTKKSHLLVRESEIGKAGFLIDPLSSNHTYAGVENWTFPCGIVNDDSGP